MAVHFEPVDEYRVREMEKAFEGNGRDDVRTL
jgi:hypothetical protein